MRDAYADIMWTVPLRHDSVLCSCAPEDNIVTQTQFETEVSLQKKKKKKKKKEDSEGVDENCKTNRTGDIKGALSRRVSCSRLPDSL